MRFSRGVLLPDCADSADGPEALLAWTLNVYAVRFASPVTLALAAGALTVVVACAAPVMYGVTVYEVAGGPPGFTQDTVAPPSTVIDVTRDGASGAPGAATWLATHAGFTTARMASCGTPAPSRPTGPAG